MSSTNIDFKNEQLNKTYIDVYNQLQKDKESINNKFSETPKLSAFRKGRNTFIKKSVIKEYANNILFKYNNFDEYRALNGIPPCAIQKRLLKHLYLFHYHFYNKDKPKARNEISKIKEIHAELIGLVSSQRVKNVGMFHMKELDKERPDTTYNRDSVYNQMSKNYKAQIKDMNAILTYGLTN